MKRPTMRGENARTLAAALGLDEDLAAQLLDQPIQISHDNAAPWARALARHAARMLSRTFRTVGNLATPVSHAAVELRIGSCAARSTAPATVWISMREGCIVIADDLEDPKSPQSGAHELYILIAACYAAARAVQRAVGPGFPYGTGLPIVVDPEALGSGIDLNQRLDLGTAFLAGAGAVGNAILYALELVQVHGVLYVVDPKKVNEGILNRCLCFESGDVGDPKAMALCARMELRLPDLRLIPQDTDLAAALRELGKGTTIERLFVGVDSRRARRSLQKELPGNVLDASTTGIAEVVLSFNSLPFEDACMACIYKQEGGEIAHEAHVAELLGVSVDEVRSGYVTEVTAARINLKYEHLAPDAIVGLAYDSLFKALCSTGQLKTSEDRQVLAPFAFVSVLSGALLVLELAIRLAGGQARFNYWRVSPWSTPVLEMRQRRPALAGCEVCSKRAFRTAAATLWG